MHNTPKQNLEFQLTSCETNLRYLLGAEELNEEAIAYNKKEIERIKKMLAVEVRNN
jgi:hypothetical protein